jgi:hypothetical protein
MSTELHLSNITHRSLPEAAGDSTPTTSCRAGTISRQPGEGSIRQPGHGLSSPNRCGEEERGWGVWASAVLPQRPCLNQGQKEEAGQGLGYQGVTSTCGLELQQQQHKPRQHNVVNKQYLV